MRCPNCKKFSKEVKVRDEDGTWSIYSDCVTCGRILVERKEISMEKLIEGGIDWVKVFLAVFLVLAAGLSGFLYYRVTQDELAIADLQSRYSDLHGNYLSLLNTSSSLQGYYDELTDMYSVLRGEYSDIEELYSALLVEKAALQDEFGELEAILNLERSVVRESNRTVELMPEGNMTFTYDAAYAGFIEVNFTASADVFFWVGGSLDEGRYYARFPAFPNTALNGTFRVPVVDVVKFKVFNPNEEVDAVVLLSIKYVY